MVGRLLYGIDFLLIVFLVEKLNVTKDGTQRCFDVV